MGCTVYLAHLIARKTESLLCASSLDEPGHHERSKEQDENHRASEDSLDIVVPGGALNIVSIDRVRAANSSPLLVAGNGGILHGGDD